MEMCETSNIQIDSCDDNAICLWRFMNIDWIWFYTSEATNCFSQSLGIFVLCLYGWKDEFSNIWFAFEHQKTQLNGI